MQDGLVAIRALWLCWPLTHMKSRLLLNLDLTIVTASLLVLLGSWFLISSSIGDSNLSCHKEAWYNSICVGALYYIVLVAYFKVYFEAASCRNALHVWSGLMKKRFPRYVPSVNRDFTHCIKLNEVAIEVFAFSSAQPGRLGCHCRSTDGGHQCLSLCL